ARRWRWPLLHGQASRRISTRQAEARATSFSAIKCVGYFLAGAAGAAGAAFFTAGGAVVPAAGAAFLAAPDVAGAPRGYRWIRIFTILTGVTGLSFAPLGTFAILVTRSCPS